MCHRRKNPRPRSREKIFWRSARSRVSPVLYKSCSLFWIFYTSNGSPGGSTGYGYGARSALTPTTGPGLTRSWAEEYTKEKKKKNYTQLLLSFLSLRFFLFPCSLARSFPCAPRIYTTHSIHAAHISFSSYTSRLIEPDPTTTTTTDRCDRFSCIQRCHRTIPEKRYIVDSLFFKVERIRVPPYLFYLRHAKVSFRRASSIRSGRRHPHGTTTGFYFNVRPLLFSFEIPLSLHVSSIATRSRGNRGKISFSVDWTTGEIRGVSYTIDQQRDKDMGRSGRLVFSSIQRRRVVFLHTFRGIGAFLFVKFPIRAAAPTRIPGVQKRFKTTRGEQSQPLSHRMFGANTLVCRRNVAIGRE